MGLGKNLSEENRVCAAQLPPQAGGTPRINPDPGPLPCRGHPHVPLGGGGVGGGPDVTRSFSQSQLPFLSPQGIPRPESGLGARPGSYDPPNLGLAEGPHG